MMDSEKNFRKRRWNTGRHIVIVVRDSKPTSDVKVLGLGVIGRGNEVVKRILTHEERSEYILN